MTDRASLPPVRRWYLILLLIITFPLITRDRAPIEIDPWAGTGGLRKIMRTLTEIRESAANYPGDSALFQAAVAAMLEKIQDPYTSFLPSQTFQSVEQFITDTPIGGIGGAFTDIPGVGLRLDTLIPNASAEQAGLKPGDVIVEVNGQSLSEMTSEEMVAALQGPVGSPVALVFRRGKEDHEVSMPRWAFPKRTVSGVEILPGSPALGYVHLQIFSHDAAEDLRVAVDRLVRRGAKGLILDLRGNGGGEMEAGIGVADLFLRKGIITKVERGDGRGGWRPGEGRDNGIHHAYEGGPFEDLPMVVLVDSGTASAAELLAGALRDNDRASLVGTQTFGKGRIQIMRALGAGGGSGGMRLTVARFLMPNGTDIEGKGLTPDVPVDLTPMEEAYLRGNLVSRWAGLPVLVEKDPVVDAATNFLREQL